MSGKGSVDGHDLFTVRFFTDAAGAAGDRVPTRKGLTASIRLPPDIVAALTKAEAKAKAAGLPTPGKSA